MGWQDYIGPMHTTLFTALGEPATLDGESVTVVARTPAEPFDVGETEYHGNRRVYGLRRPPIAWYRVGSVLDMRGELFEVMSIQPDGQGLDELVVRKRRSAGLVGDPVVTGTLLPVVTSRAEAVVVNVRTESGVASA